MNCAEANQIDLVEYLDLLGYQPQKIRNDDYWYLSPLRNEQKPSFKVNKLKNVWYDHGFGKGGKTVNFAMQYFNCGLSEALLKIPLFHQQNNLQETLEKEPFLKHKTVVLNEGDATKTAIKIISIKHPITDPSLCCYIKSRNIVADIANKFCSEISYSLHDKIYNAIGFKNSAGGHELMNEVFKASSSPKYVSYIDNKSNNLSVFEGFFDFLSYQSMHLNQPLPLTNFLVLNSLSFFEKSLLLMEKHDKVYLYLDNDEAGRKCTAMVQKRSLKFQDESHFYKGCKDLNEWLMNANNNQKEEQRVHRQL